MRRMIVVALAVLGVCMAATASASAHLFHASNTGKLLGLQTNNQIFINNGQEVKCKHAVTLGTVTEKLALLQSVTVHYSECEAFLSPTEIGPAQYLLSADGLAAIVTTIQITVKGVGNCQIKVLPQNLGTVKYDNQASAGAILELSEVHSIKSDGSGGLCGTNNTGGTYTGNNLITLDPSGTISWL